MQTNEQWAENVKQIYTTILQDIMENKNLELHLKDVEGAIVEIDKSIADAEDKGQKSVSLKSVKNDLYYLKYEILERL